MLDLLGAVALGEWSPRLSLIQASANPAAGADPTLTVPGGRVWNVLTVRGTLVTDATAANRHPRLRIDNGTTTVVESPIATAITASLTSSVSWAQGFGSSFGAVTALSFAAPLPTPLVLPAGWRLVVSTLNLQAADDWSALSALVIEADEGVSEWMLRGYAAWEAVRRGGITSEG